MTRTKKQILATVGSVAVLAAVFSLVMANPTLAADSTGLHATAGKAGLKSMGTNIYGTIGSIINTLLGMVGVLFMAVVIYAGYLWMTASGNAEQAKKAKTMIIQAALGLVVVFSAYAVTDFVLGAVMNSAGQAVEQGTEEADGE